LAKQDVGLLCFTLVPAMLLTSSIIGIMTMIPNLLMRRKLFVTLMNLTTWGNVVCIYILLVLIDSNAETILFGIMIWQSIMVVITLYVVKKILDNNEPIRSTQKIDWREVWKFCWPVVIIEIMFWAQSSGYRIPLKSNVDSTGFAVFCICYSVAARSFDAFQSVFVQMYDPMFWKSIADSGYKDSDLDNYIKNHWPYLIIFTFWIIGICIFALRIMVAEQYVKYYYIVMLISITELIRHMARPFYNSIYAVQITKLLIPPGIFSLIMCLGGTYILGRIIDPIIAVILCLGIAHLGTIIITGVSVRKYSKFKLPWKQLGIAIGFGIVLAGLCLALSSSWLSSTIVGSIAGLAIGCILFTGFAFCLSKLLLKVSNFTLMFVNKN
jgi:hypothetical protein